MADQTVSFKADQETKDKVRKATDVYDGTQKEWLAKALALMETQSLKAGSPAYAEDLSELEVHTTRIYELITSMIQRSVYIKEHAVRDLEAKLENQREITSGFQLRIREAESERDEAHKQLDQSKLAEQELLKQLADSHEQLDTNKLLIIEYKEKNDTLNGLMTRYQGYAEENDQLKGELNKERQTHEKKMMELTRQATEQDARIVALEQHLKQQEKTHQTESEQMTKVHQMDIERLNGRRDLEQERALLKAEREHQKELAKVNDQYSRQLQSMYEQLRDERKTSRDEAKAE